MVSLGGFSHHQIVRLSNLVLAAFNAIKKQIEACSVGIKSVFLVGGYAASPWLFSQLQERLKALNVVVSRPDTQTYVLASLLSVLPITQVDHLTAPKQSRMERLVSTATTTSRHECPSLCMASSTLEPSTPTTQST